MACSILEFEKLHWAAHPSQGQQQPGIDVIIPSLPGFGYSDHHNRGWATAYGEGFSCSDGSFGLSKYGIQGGDWGSAIAQDMAYQAPTQ